MKIIGRTDDGGLILAAAVREVARIAGYHGELNMHTAKIPEGDRSPVMIKRDGYHTEYTFKIGAEVAVSPMWDWMTAMRKAYDDVQGAVHVLRASALILEKAAPPAIKGEEEGNA